MSLSFIARVLRQLAIMFVFTVLVGAGFIYYVGKQHQQAAIDFWGSNTSLMPSLPKLIGGLSVTWLFLAGANYFSEHCWSVP